MTATEIVVNKHEHVGRPYKALVILPLRIGARIVSLCQHVIEAVTQLDKPCGEGGVFIGHAIAPAVTMIAVREVWLVWWPVRRFRERVRNVRMPLAYTVMVRLFRLGWVMMVVIMSA